MDDPTYGWWPLDLAIIIFVVGFFCALLGVC